MAVAAAAVALLLLGTIAAVAGIGGAKGATAALHAVPRDMADLAALQRTRGKYLSPHPRACTTETRSVYLVTLDRRIGATGGSTTLRAVTGDMAGLVAPVAGLRVLGTLGAVSALWNCESLFRYLFDGLGVLTHVTLI